MLQGHGVIAGDDARFFVAQDRVEIDIAQWHKGTGGIPRRSRKRRVMVRQKDVPVIGPTTVGVSPPGFVVELNHHAVDGTAAGPALSSPLMNQLTTGERQVALCLSNGLSNQEIADKLEKSVPAVKYLLHRIYTKTSLPSRAAVVAALRHTDSPQQV